MRNDGRVRICSARDLDLNEARDFPGKCERQNGYLFLFLLFFSFFSARIIPPLSETREPVTVT